VKVPFSIGTYKDEVIYDVVPMEPGHLLLGKPWQYDRKIIYNGLTNEITLTHLGTKFVLYPQTPSQVAKDQVEIKFKWDEEKNRKTKEEQTLIVKEECKEVSVSSKRLAKKESHFAIKKNINKTSLLRQPSRLLLCKRTLVSTTIPLELEVIPQVK